MKCAGEEIAEDAAVINIILIGLIQKIRNSVVMTI